LLEPGTALGRKTRRLVQHKEMLVHVEDRTLQATRSLDDRRGFRPLFNLVVDDLRRQAHDLSGDDAIRGFGALAIHPHFALAQKLFQSPMSESRKMTAEPAIDTDAVIVIGNDALLRHKVSERSRGRQTRPGWTTRPSRSHRRSPEH